MQVIGKEGERWSDRRDLGVAASGQGGEKGLGKRMFFFFF